MRLPTPWNMLLIGPRAKHASRPVARIGIAGKALLTAVAIVAAPLGLGLLKATQAPTSAYHPDETSLLHSNALKGVSFKAVTLTPSKDNGGRPFTLSMTATGLSTIHSSMKDLIRFAYHAKSYDQIVGGPRWIDTEFYDVKADWPDSDSANAAINKLPADQQADVPRMLMQSLLTDRFRLRASFQTRDLAVYALLVAEGGPKLKEVEPATPALDTAPAPGAHVPSLVFTTPTEVTAVAMNMHAVADFLSIFDELGGHLAVDETGLKGDYDFVIKGVSPTNAKKPTQTPIFRALRDQLGLKLELGKATGVEVLVVDHAEPPSTN